MVSVVDPSVARKVKLSSSAGGKDRTGVVIALISDVRPLPSPLLSMLLTGSPINIKLAGIEKDSIALDYQFSRVGLEPDRDAISKGLMDSGPPFNDKEVAKSMLLAP